MNKRIVALDVGDVRIGIAVSDPTGTIAQPVETYKRVGWGPDCRYIKALCDRYETDLLLLGLPLNMDGTEGFQAQKVRRFGEKLAECGLILHWQDERMTTVTAEDVLISGSVSREDRKKYVDKLAATVILEQWLAKEQEEKTMTENNENIMNEGIEEEEGFITLQDEEGNDVNFVHVATVEYKENYYVVLEATEDTDDCKEGESIILKIIRDEETDEDVYATIEDEEELEGVIAVIEEQMEDEDAEFGEYPEE